MSFNDEVCAYHFQENFDVVEENYTCSYSYEPTYESFGMVQDSTCQYDGAYEQIEHFEDKKKDDKKSDKKDSKKDEGKGAAAPAKK